MASEYNGISELDMATSTYTSEYWTALAQTLSRPWMVE
jgi:hypothetical protein